MKAGRWSSRCIVLGVIVSQGTVEAVRSEETHGVPRTNAAVALTDVVATATRIKQDALSLPCTAYRLDGAQSQVQKATRTTPDALKGLPSVLVQKTAYGQGSPYLRGFTGFRTLSLIDGIRLNNSVFRDGPNQYWNTVDPLSVRDYELVMGPSSVLYGSDAIGGTLNSLPIEPPDYGGQPAWERRLYYRGATAERSSIGRMEIGGRVSEAIGFVGGVSLKDFGDLRGGHDVGRQERTGYDERDYDARLNYYVSPDSRLTLGHQTVDQEDAWRTHRTVYGIDWEGLAHGDDLKYVLDQQRDLTYLSYRADGLDGWVNAVQATLSRQVQQEDQYRLKADSKGEQQGFDVQTWGTTLQLMSDRAAGKWVYGVEYYRDRVASYGRKYKEDGALDKVEIQGPVADDASYDSVGLYLEDNLSLLDDRLEAVPGLRYTHSRADAAKVKDPVSGRPLSVEGEWNAAAGSLRVLHPLVATRGLVAFGGVSQGFRAPNLSDLTRLDMARSTELETPVSDLAPERYISYEAGVKAECERWKSQLACYYTVIDNMIVRAPTGRTIDRYTEVTKRNSGRGYVQGLEWSSTYAITPAWSTWLNASWMDGAVDAYPSSDTQRQREYISRLMPLTAEIGLRWRMEDGTFWVEALCDMAARADHLSADDTRDTQRIPPGGTPGYAVYSVRTGARIASNVRLTLAVENLTDADYRIHGSGVNEPGRNAVLAADYRF